MAPKVSFIVFGASGDLAHRKTFPALLRLYGHGDLDFLSSKIIGFARTDLGKEGLVKKLRSKIDEPSSEDSAMHGAYKQLLSEVEYVRASEGYDKDDSYKTLNKYLEEVERQRDATSAIASHASDPSSATAGKHMRVFYLALPPESFAGAAEMIHKHCWNGQTINRIIIEKPYGMDLNSAKNLSTSLAKHYKEQDIYRIDHYLGKDILRQLLVLRFSSAGNTFDSLFHHNRVSYVTLDFKETLGVEGRGGYFDKAGIVRDVMVNHVMSFLIFATMEQPQSLSPEDFVGARIDLLNAITVVRPEDVLIGQYGADPHDPEKKAYRDDESTKNDSKASTYAACVFYINNARWHGVPFILRAGKALDEDRVELTLNFKRQTQSLFPEAVASKLVIRDKPQESIEFYTAAKTPGYSFKAVPASLSTNVHDLGPNEYIPQPYEALFRAAIVDSDQTWFIGHKEAEVLWRIWHRYLAEVEGVREPFIYAWGSKGPTEFDDFMLEYIEERRKRENNIPTEIAHTVVGEVGRIVEQGKAGFKAGMQNLFKQAGYENKVEE